MDFDDFFMNRSAYTSPEINMFKMCAARGQRLREGTAHILNMLISEGSGAQLRRSSAVALPGPTLGDPGN